jgi:hypothetical protein
VTSRYAGDRKISKFIITRLRDELWFKGRGWFQDRSCSMLQDDDALIAELMSPTVVQSKADMKKRGMCSPDLAFLLTFACGSGVQAVSSSRVPTPAPGHGC